MDVIEDSNSRERIFKLLRHKSSQEDDGNSKSCVLTECINDVKEWQIQIFCMPGEDLKAIKKSKF